MSVVISSSQQTTRLLIEFHIEPIGHLDRCCSAADQLACLDISSGGQETSQLARRPTAWRNGRRTGKQQQRQAGRVAGLG